MFSPTGFFLFTAWLTAAAVSYWAVRDIFSPDKLLLVALGLFFGDIYFSEYSIEMYLSYILLLLTFMTALVVLAPLVKRRKVPAVSKVTRQVEPGNGRALFGYKYFWLLSVPALAAQFAMIQHFGGLAGYINALALSVVNFEGLGWLMWIIKTFFIINLLYFSYLVTRRTRTKREVVIYLLHLFIFVLMGLATGSRGSLLVNFALMPLIYHHSVRRISVKWLFIFAVSALLLASILEVAREGVRFGEEGLVTGLSQANQEKKMSFGWATYGLIPLNLVLGADHVNMHYGFTYLTVFTNFVPRAIWPGKPDPGGNVLTNEYAGDVWGGTSFLSTGILPEAIINFGHAFGMLFGMIQFAMLVAFLLLYYIRYRRRQATDAPFKFGESVTFAYLSWGMMGLVVGEFTNVMVGLIIQLTTVWVLQKLLRLIANNCPSIPLRRCSVTTHAETP